MKNILSVDQFDKNFLEEILKRASTLEQDFKRGKLNKLLENKIIACMFFEPSTRTRLSFETAVLRLGGEVVSSENALLSSSSFKGESIQDTVRVLSSYADALVMRHPKEGSLALAGEVATIPVINAGDGGNEHPTQALLDLYTIKKHMGRLDNLNIAFGFDPKHSRTIRSLVKLLSCFNNNNFTFVCPRVLDPAPDLLEYLKEKNMAVNTVDNLKNFADYDVFYTNRLQEERFQDKAEFKKYRKTLVLTKKIVEKSKTLILDPLPRIDEIEEEVDSLPNAVYFKQAEYGVYIRMALLLYIFEL